MTSKRELYMSAKIRDFASKHKITNEQAVRILYDVKSYNEIWSIVGFDDHLLNTAHLMGVKL